MNRLTETFVRRPTLAAVVILLTIVAGAVAYPGLVQQQFPSVDLPVVEITANLSGATPDDMRDTVARPIEDQMAGAPGLDHLTTTIQQGTTTIAVFFSLTTNQTEDLVEVQRRLQSAQSQLPAQVKAPSLATYDPSQGTVVELTAASNTLATDALSNTVNNGVVPAIEQLPGVSSVQTSGDVTPAIVVNIDPQRLQASGAAMTDVINAVTNNNVRAPGGIATNSGRETTIDIRGDIQTPNSVAHLLLNSPSGPPTGMNAWTTAPYALQVRDVASTSFGYETQRVFAYRRGSSAIVLDVLKTSNASEVNVSHAVLNDLPALRKQFPGIAFDVVNVQANYTKQQINEVWRSLFEAIALTAIVMLFFLRSWRNAAVVCVAIPTSLLITICAMRLFNFTLDTVSLAAMTLVIGILVDDSTVVLENVERHFDAGEDPITAAINGRGEIAMAAVTLTLVDVVVFTPLAFLPGTVGKFMQEFGIVVAVATIASLFVSFAVTPALAGNWALFSKWKPWKPIAIFTAAFDKVRGWYAHRALPWAISHPRTVVTISVLSVIFAFALAPLGLIAFEFLPPVDNGEVAVQVTYPVGTAIATTRSGMRKVEHLIQGLPQVHSETALAGSYQAEFGSFVAEGFIGQVHVYLNVVKGHSSEAWLQQMLPKARALLPQATILGIPATGIGGGTSQPISYVVSTTNGDLAKYAQAVYGAMTGTPGLQNVTISELQRMPNVEVHFSRDQARTLGVTVGTAASAIRAAFGGTIPTQYNSPYGTQDVQVIYPLDRRDSLHELQAIPLRSSSGNIVYAGDVARFIAEPTDPLVTRLNRQDVVYVSANIANGYAQSGVTKAFTQRLAGLHLPGYVTVTPPPSGAAQNLSDTMKGIAASLLLSFILVFLLMVALYNSYRLPFIIMFSIPVTAFGALGSLALFHQTLNLFSMIGTLLLVGLVTKNGILLVDFANRLNEAGRSRAEAIAQSAATRFRPIVMTTLSMVAGMLPIALALEPGSEVRRSLGVVVIGGLLSSLALTLLLVPVVYMRFAPERRGKAAVPIPAIDGAPAKEPV